ncbi:hypothetical protein ACS0TY_015354 [Phlomoides rotata]
MCILCVIQKWSRRIATMLPWLVIPLIGLWALSQLLPPAFRFEITSPRLACLLVLLVTLFWYEILMPQLSAWRVRRSARLRERKRFEAIEMQKLRKTATRRCRNCFTAYRDQNPGGGKFMCSYCGHISKRPVLDLPVPPGMGNTGILKDLVGKGGKILNGKAWIDNGWMCGQDWLDNGTRDGGPFAGNLSYWKKNNGGILAGLDKHCLGEKSYSRVFIFACKMLTAFLLSLMWLWRKVFRVSSSRADTSADAERRGMLDNGGENGGNGQESRGEKARRKAEEKRQARLEKELLEEEEKKQREEVARLVEEQRRLRDEKMVAEKERGKGSPRAKERGNKKESERKRHEKRKEKDRGSSKSNSDVEELEKKAGKEGDQNKKTDSDRREQHRTTAENMKAHGTELGHGFKGAAVGNHNRGNAGRYLDRMRGTLLSSSRALTGGGFFGKSINSPTVSRDHKPIALVENTQTTYRKEIVQPDQVSARSNVNGDDKSSNRPVLLEPQPCTAPKKSWQQLFTRSSAVSPPNSNVISRPIGTHKAEVQSPPFHPTPTQSFDNPPINFGLSSPFSLPSFPFGSSSSSSSTTLPGSSEAVLPKMGGSSNQFLPEELEIFEDPCYVPDPIALLGPVSESLDSFQLDLGFVNDMELEKPGAVKTKVAPTEVTKPSPIESPLSRSRVSEDNAKSVNDNGTWHMWNSSPLVQDGLGLVGGTGSWLLHPEMNLPNKEDNVRQVPHKTMASLFKKDEQTSYGSHPSQHVLFGNSQNGGTFPLVDGTWLPRTLFGPTPIPEKQVMLKPNGEAVQNGHIYGNSSLSAANHHFELSGANSWAK